MSDPQAILSQAIESATGTLDLAVQAAQHGAADAARRQRTLGPLLGGFVNRFVYATCYSTSYGMVFPAVLLARCIPVNISAVRGLIDGADAAPDG